MMNDKHPWLETLLKQYFVDLDDVIILNNDVNIVVSLQNTQQQYTLVKPVTISSLITIIEQLENIIQLGPISFYPKQRLCLFNSQEINLTQKETEILLYLFEHPYYIDKITLLEAIWGYASNISTYTLEAHIYKLRNKFAPGYEMIISNEKGYALNLA